MMWLPRRGISNDELDKALAASRRHAAFTDSPAGADRQVQDELRMIAIRANCAASRAPDDLRPMRHHPMLWKTAWGVAAACIAVVAVGAIGAGAFHALRASGQPGSMSALMAGMAAIVSSWVIGTLLLLSANGIKSLDRYLTGMRARRQHGHDHGKGFGNPGAEEGSRLGDTVTG